MSGKGSIPLSPRHGLNPMLSVCFFCGAEKNEIALLGKLENDREAPRKGVVDYTPCKACAEMMQRGILLCEVRDNEPDRNNPYRTGPMVVVTEECAGRMGINYSKIRFAFIAKKSLMDLLGDQYCKLFPNAGGCPKPVTESEDTAASPAPEQDNK